MLSLSRRAVLAAIATAPAWASVVLAAERPYEVEHYAAQIEPDLSERTLTGSVLIELTIGRAEQRVIELDRGELDIKRVTISGAPQQFTLEPRHLLVHLATAARAGAHLGVLVEYEGAPHSGLEFHPDQSQLYTVFATSEWLVCNDIPSDKATFDLRIVLPAGLTVIANGTPVRQHLREDGKQVSDWRESHRLPAYTYGFAAGPFTQVTDDRGRLKFLGAGLSGVELRRIFHDTADMRAFFEERSGVAYEGPTYSQAVVVDTIGQELGEFSLLSREYAESVLADPKAISTVAHEFAHQWWGNRVTCEDWTEMWLNEAFAVFMSAAYMERRFGRQAYLDAIETSHHRYELVREKGEDHALVFGEWKHPSASNRTVVYHKGAYFLHLLREELGDRVFWKGIRDYTRQYLDKSVTTGDFERSMERSSHRDLSAFFGTWVYADGTTGFLHQGAPLGDPVLHAR